jgi:hypothetical protein
MKHTNQSTVDMRSKAKAQKYRSKITHRVFVYKTSNNKKVCHPELLFFYWVQLLIWRSLFLRSESRMSDKLSFFLLNSFVNRNRSNKAHFCL